MEEASKLKGRICRQNIKANSQIVADFFENTEELIEEGKSIFVIKPSWMDMRSSSLRSGDIVQIYSDTGVYISELSGWHLSRMITNRKLLRRTGNFKATEYTGQKDEQQSRKSYRDSSHT